MPSNKKYLFIVAAILLMVVLFAYFFSGSSKNRISWREDFNATNQGPYGTYLTLKLLDQYFPNDEVKILTDSIPTILDAVEEPANYFFIGDNMYMDSLSENSLLAFVERGNTAFITCKIPPFELMQQIFYDDCSEYDLIEYDSNFDTTGSFNLFHPDLNLGDSVLNMTFRHNFNTTRYQWHFFPSTFFCEENDYIASLGSMNETNINFIKIEYGEGSFYFHTNPILFTNWVLKAEPRGFDYVHRSFAHLQEGAIFWDKRSRIWHYDGGSNNYTNGKKTFESEGPLQYVLAQPPLAWAWYIALGLGLLYFLFRAKRQQRVIPVAELNRNTSLEFIATIGRMYFVENNHRKLLDEKMKLFLTYVRENYKIQTRNLDKNFVQQLADKAEVPKELIEKIISQYQNAIARGLVSEDVLIGFHQVLDEFYKRCK